ncbi:hypothetical protein [Streptomyces sp. WZ-12]|uniref:hypothetical protein n=1 Tax=Streptomyces sp. WZ-12 TaxID=3030210 RepID=UPI00238191EC|nr:hypothetical protein [Streptomyces sp. WZ-12]
MAPSTGLRHAADPRRAGEAVAVRAERAQMAGQVAWPGVELGALRGARLRGRPVVPPLASTPGAGRRPRRHGHPAAPGEGHRLREHRLAGRRRAAEAAVAGGDGVVVSPSGPEGRARGRSGASALPTADPQLPSGGAPAAAPEGRTAAHPEPAGTRPLAQPARPTQPMSPRSLRSRSIRPGPGSAKAIGIVNDRP